MQEHLNAICIGQWSGYFSTYDAYGHHLLYCSCPPGHSIFGAQTLIRLKLNLETCWHTQKSSGEWRPQKPGQGKLGQIRMRDSFNKSMRDHLSMNMRDELNGKHECAALAAASDLAVALRPCGVSVE